MDYSEGLEEQNSEKTISTTSLNSAFILSSNESVLLLNGTSDNGTARGKVLTGDSTECKQISNTECGFSESTSYLAFPDPCKKFANFGSEVSEHVDDCDTNEDIFTSNVEFGNFSTDVSDDVDDSDSNGDIVRSNVEFSHFGTEVSYDHCDNNGDIVRTNAENNAKIRRNTSLSKILKNMFDTILGRTSDKSKTSIETLSSGTSLSASELEQTESFDYEESEKVSYSSSSILTETHSDTTNDGEKTHNRSVTKLLTILEGSNESASNLSSSQNWSRMCLGKLTSFASRNHSPRKIKHTTYINDDTNQTESINLSTSNDVESNHSFETYNKYFDTIDSSFSQYFEESGEFLSASELSITEERSPDVTNVSDTSSEKESSLNNNSEEAIVSKLHKKIKKDSFGFVNNENSRKHSISTSIESESHENSVEANESTKVDLTQSKKKSKTRKRRSTSLSDFESIHAISCEETSKGNSYTPLSPQQYYAQQKSPQVCRSATKMIFRTNRNWKTKSPHLSSWRSPVVVTSPIKSVNFLRNLFERRDIKIRSFKKSPLRKARSPRPVISITPASPL